MLVPMTRRPVSPAFVGRDAELESLRDAFDQARKRATTTVLIGGEAGVGKTRLLARFAEEAGLDGAHVLIGGCVELSAEGLAYAPFIAVLRQLVRELSAAEVTALLPDGAARDLARLLPEFGEPNADGDTESARIRLFELILILVERLAERRPVLLAIEDVHWADRSSRDLIAFLSRNLTAAPVLMVLTYRSDELHRTHPLRPVLAELGRLGSVVRIELPRFTRHEVALQVAGILGTTPEYDRVTTIFERSGGIPLFVEALLEAGEDCAVPESLHDLILRPVDRLPERTQQVLRIAAAGGVRVGHDLLAAVSGLSDAELEDALRPAIAANVLQVADGRAYAFRHALIREAVHDELLPGEHARLHARYAEEIGNDHALVPPGRAAFEIAHHWYAARNDLWALISAWEAAEAAHRSFAYTEQAQFLDRVLALWDKVPDAAERIGADHVGVLERAAEAAFVSGDMERGLRYVKAALAELDEKTAPERVAELLVRRANINFQRGRPGALDDLRRAERLVPEPSDTRTTVLLRLGYVLLLNGQVTEGTKATQEALEIARRKGDERNEADLVLNLSLGHWLAGDLEQARVLDDRAISLGKRLNFPLVVLRALANKIDTLDNLGRSEEAVALADEGERLARQYGRYRHQGVFIANNRAEALVSLGRWDEAVEVVERALAMDPAPRVRAHCLRVRTDIAIARGEQDVARAGLAELRALTDVQAEGVQELANNTRLLICWHLLMGEPLRAIEVAERLFDAPLRNKPLLAWRLSATIRYACEAAAAVAPERAAALRARVAELSYGDRPVEGHGPVCEAYRHVARGSFDTAAEMWRRLNRPYERALALVHAAQTVVASGDREGVAVRLREAHPIATQLGTAPLAARIETLARRHQIPLGRPGTARAGSAGPGTAGAGSAGGVALTPREREVLRLVAAGRTNREIAAELFISAKTVSVHVSNILAKLGTATRGEAAAAAHRLSLLD